MSEEESSESDSFYDAEDTEDTICNSSTRSSGGSRRKSSKSSTLTSPAPAPSLTVGSSGSPVVESQIEILTGDQLSSRDQRWSRLEKLRRREELEREEREEREGRDGSREEPDSTESSVEGIYVSGVRSLHPFKVVEPDSRSLQSGLGSDTKSVARSSLGLDPDSRFSLSLEPEPRSPSVPEPEHRVRFNSESCVLEARSLEKELEKIELTSIPEPRVYPEQVRCEEGLPNLIPDIVSSTHPSSPPKPTAPPRRKKRAVGLSRETSVENDVFDPRLPTLPILSTILSKVPAIPTLSKVSTLSNTPPDLPSPNTTVNSITRDLEETLLYSTPNSEDKRTQSELDNSLQKDEFSEPGNKDGAVGLEPGRKDSFLDPKNLGLRRSFMKDFDGVSGLNINLACRGEYVVKPQDDERTRGITAEDREKLFKDTLDFSPDTGVGSSGANFSQDPGAGALGSTETRSSLTKSKSPEEGRRDSLRSRSYRTGGSGGYRTEGHQSGSSGGYHSGGSGGQHSVGRQASGKGSGGSDRRSVAGSIGSGGSDGGIIKQLGMYVRTKSDSGKKLTDQEILQQIKVKNLDTGTEMDLATAEEHLPQSINPLSLHIMRLTSEYTGTLSSSVSMNEGTLYDSDTESILSSISDFEIGQGKKKKTFSKLFGEVAKTAAKASKRISAEVSKRQRTREEKEEEKLGRLATDISTTDGVQVSCKDGAAAQGFKRIQAHKSGPWDFENIQFGQDLSGHHSGPIWCMKFSLCGRLLATAGQDCILRIWVLRDKHGYFSDMRRRYQVEHEGISDEQVHQDQITQGYLESEDSQGHIFMDRPFVTYTGHTSDLLDISWSSNFFILTSSMDKTVRLWHISRKECLCVFQHIDFVTAIGFHPRNDKFFISGSLDGKIRLWNIPDKKVALWNEVDGQTKLITAANFCQNGKFAVVGTYDGRCIFYSTDQLKYHTTIHVRSARGKNSRGRKVTGIEPMPGEDKILVTSTDSRIRLYDLRDLSLICKYRGYTNLSSQIRACFSPDGRYVSAGSENHCVYLWSSVHVPSSLTARKDRNNYYEAIKAHNAAVTCTLFAPVPELVFEAVERGREAAGRLREKEGVDPVGDKEPLTGYAVISGDYDGDIKVFIKEGKKKTSLPRH